MPDVLWCSIRDSEFAADPRAAYLTGRFGDPWFAEFGGVGPSPAPYSMKVVSVDGIVYRPLSRFEMVITYPDQDPDSPRAWVPIAHQPPDDRVKMVKNAKEAK